MQKHKNKFIAAGIIIAVLAIAWVWGGNYANRGGSSAATVPIESASPSPSAAPSATPPLEPTPSAEPSATPTPLETPSAAPTPSASPKQEINRATGKDEYRTDPVPDGKPLPVEPEEVSVGTAAYTCTLSVRCDSILANMHALDPEKVELVPDDGVIFAAKTVTFYEGESVFNVLQREMKREKIHMSFRNTPIYNSAYIEAVNNLYEFDCGELSGWMYKVNGWFPNYGCSRYQLKQGDVIEWIYTCDLGRDIGGDSAIGGQGE